VRPRAMWRGAPVRSLSAVFGGRGVEGRMTRKHPRRRERPVVDRYGRTPLHDAALAGDVEEARRLLQAGADPSAADDDGWTPLHAAAQNWHVDVVVALLEAGANVDARDSHGNTALSTAVFNSRGRGDVIVALRRHGADPHAANRHGVSPLALARTIANYDVAQHFTDLP
jgi:ankyrin repeat protein